MTPGQFVLIASASVRSRRSKERISSVFARVASTLSNLARHHDDGIWTGRFRFLGDTFGTGSGTWATQGPVLVLRAGVLDGWG